MTKLVEEPVGDQLTPLELDRISRLSAKLKGLGVKPVGFLAAAVAAEERLRTLLGQGNLVDPSGRQLVDLVGALPAWSEDEDERPDVIRAPTLIGQIERHRSRARYDPRARTVLGNVGAVLGGKRPPGRITDSMAVAQDRIDYRLYLQIRDLFYQRIGQPWKPRAVSESGVPWRLFEGTDWLEPVFSEQAEAYIEDSRRRESGAAAKSPLSPSVRSALVLLLILRRRKNKRARVRDEDFEAAEGELDRIKKSLKRRRS